MTCAPTSFFPRKETVSHTKNAPSVMLSKAKHLAFSVTYKDEILRLRLRMTHDTVSKRGRMKEGEFD
jgi:hypothetical protein